MRQWELCNGESLDPTYHSHQLENEAPINKKIRIYLFRGFHKCEKITWLK